MDTPVQRTIKEYNRIATLTYEAVHDTSVPEGSLASHKDMEHDLYEIAFGQHDEDSFYGWLQAMPELVREIDNFVLGMDVFGVWPVTDFQGWDEDGQAHVLTTFVRAAEFKIRHTAWKAQHGL